MQPSVGRIVHYTSYGTPGGEYPSVCRAAIITAVDEYQPPGPDGKFVGHVALCVLNPEGMFFNRSVHQSAGDPSPDAAGARCGVRGLAYQGGTWHWPERV